MTQCHICGESLKQPSKCILCDEYVCDNHSRSFEVGQEKSGNDQKKVNAYVCDECMQAVEELKKKPREEWTEEDKGKSKGMMEKIIMALGAAGMAIITGIFMFATWVYAKSVDGEESEMNDSSVPEGGGPEEFANAETSFTQEDTFSGGQP